MECKHEVVCRVWRPYRLIPWLQGETRWHLLRPRNIHRSLLHQPFAPTSTSPLCHSCSPSPKDGQPAVSHFVRMTHFRKTHFAAVLPPKVTQLRLNPLKDSVCMRTWIHQALQWVVCWHGIIQTGRFTTKNWSSGTKIEIVRHFMRPPHYSQTL